MEPKEILLRMREHFLKMTESRCLPTLESVKPEELGHIRNYPTLPDRSRINDKERAGLQEECNAILAGHWHVLRGHCFEVTLPPNWHTDYLCGKEVLYRGPARLLNHRSLSEGIDPRIVWETSRWIQLVRLAQLSWLENDVGLTETIIAMLEDWVKENPLGHGINWTSPMEPAIRLTNFTWIHALISGVDLDQKLKKRLSALTSAIVPGHVWWVWRYHSHGTSANNHLLGELCGLILAQARWPGCHRWSKSFSQLSDFMSKELLTQFAEDGGNLEQGLHYHIFAWEMGWQVLCAMRFMGCEVEAEVEERMARASYFFSKVVSPDEPWDFGDSDDAHVTPVFLHEETCLKEWQAWLLGEVGGRYFSHWFGNAPCSDTGAQHHGEWIFFPKSGYAILRNGKWMLRLDGSPLGFGNMAAHGHIDALHLSIWYDSKAIVVDPGTGSYFDNRETRDYLLSAQAHNAPYLLGEGIYPKHMGPFLWVNHHEAPNWNFGSNGPTVRVRHGDTVIARSVFYQDGVVTVRDRVEQYEGYLHTHWQFAPQTKAEQNEGRLDITRDGIHITCTSKDSSPVLRDEEKRASPGHCSAYFRSEQFAPVAVITGTASEGNYQQETIFTLT